MDNETSSSLDPPVAKPAETPPYTMLTQGELSVKSDFFGDAQIAPPTFPCTHLTRSQALVDLLSVAAALIAGQFLLGNVAQLLKETLESTGEFFLNTILGVMTLAVVGLALFLRRLSYSSVGLNRPSIGVLLISAAAAIPVCYMVTAAMGFMFLTFNYATGGANIEDVARQREEFFAMVPDPSIATFVLFAAFTGLHEELLFRGFALPRLIALFRYRWAGILACSVLFGLAHNYQGTMSVFQTAGLGFVFCLVAVGTRSIWPAVIAHALFNAINLALIPVLRDMLPELINQISTQPSQ
ncbi:MAG: CPBP family intramembrane metalloprotease [Planctomycetes bacterium]|nr:CPBP family intramembrane metalloprotease [Planctomycetota bacterium]